MPHRLQRCQKHPLTKTAARSIGNTISGFPGREATFVAKFASPNFRSSVVMRRSGNVPRLRFDFITLETYLEVASGGLWRRVLGGWDRAIASDRRGGRKWIASVWVDDDMATEPA